MRLDFPDPETPVTQVRSPIGMSTFTFFKLFLLAFLKLRTCFLLKGFLFFGTSIDILPDKYLPVSDFSFFKTGLHFQDIKQLLKVLHKLRDQGNTVVVIEHNLDVIKTADWIIDLGPKGGDKGGEIIAEGTPENIVKSKKSLTGKFLKKIL